METATRGLRQDELETTKDTLLCQQLMHDSKE